MSVAVRRRTLFATRRSRTISFWMAVTVGAVAAALLTRAEPTGQTTADAFWSASLVAVLAIFGATARRWTWFLPAGVAAMIAGDGLAVAFAAVAIAIAFVSVLRDTRSRARGALVTALGGIALLRAEPIGFHGLSALLAAAAILPAIVSGYAHAGRRVRDRARRVALLAGGTIVFMVAGAALGLLSVQGDVADGMRAIDNGMAAARDADDDLAAEELGHASRALSAADSTLSSWFVAPAKSLPVIGPNLDAVSSLAAQASDVAAVTSLAANQADVDALRFVGGRLDPQAVADMEDPLLQVESALQRLSDEVERARSPWLVSLVSTRIDRLSEQVDEALPEAENAILAVKLGPHLLGADGPQRYLVLFTTPVEARGRTGFPGNYAELYVEDGKLSMPVFGRISELEQGGLGSERTLTQPAELVARYSRFDVASTWRNLPMTPDFVSLAQAAAELYPQSGGQPIDGVLSVDPAGLAAIMRYTGPVEVAGLAEPLTADNAEDYLLFEQYVQFEEDNEERVQVLDDVARTTFDRLTSVDLPGPRALSEQLDPVVDGGHIQFVNLDAESLIGLQLTPVTGYFVPPDGNDTVTVTTANAGASKIDVFLHRREQYDVRWNPDTGQVTGTLRVTLENTAPAEGWPDYVIGNTVGLPKGTNRSYVSIYSPFDLQGSRVGGQPASLQAEVELGRNVYSTFVDIPPGGSIDIELDLAGSLDGRRYELALPVQPFVTPDEIAVSVEVAGGGPVVSRQAEVESNVARWSSTLDLPRTLTVSAPRG
ncbi:MAG TPA: DUF4012 domain-containing protein [Acidimicrobiales bacterium]